MNEQLQPNYDQAMGGPNFSRKLPAMQGAATLTADPPPPRDFKSLAVVVYSLFAVMVEYSVVAPSLLLYMRHLDPGAPTWLFGVLVGAFSAAQIVTAPLFGAWNDSPTRCMREVTVACLFLGILGNTLYLLAPNVWVLLLARLVSGVGGNINSTGQTYVIRVSSPEERTKLTGQILLVCNLGILIGPALNYPLSRLPLVQLGVLSLGPLNAPGLLMIVMLTLGVCLIYTWYREPEFVEKSAAPAVAGSCMQRYRPLFRSWTILAMVMLNFFVQFTQQSLETFITPIAQAYYGFGQLEFSIMYASIAVVFFFWFIVIATQSWRFLDRTLICMGVLFLGLAFWAMIVTLFVQPPEPQWHLPLWAFGLTVGVIASGLPFFLATVNSLFSKLVDNKHIQGMAQSLMTASGGCAWILAPLLTGIVVPLGARFIYVMLTCGWACVVLIVVLQWRALVPKPTTTEQVLPMEVADRPLRVWVEGSAGEEDDEERSLEWD